MREIVAMDLAGLDAVDFVPGEAARQRPRYLALLLERGLAAQPGGSRVSRPSEGAR